ncbi:hypothetical protein B0A62_13975 [Flavobacterium hydatis]|jgi:hypothetical protein|uniref:Uncharacterized protein n=1 Tax=Flavobacterium hydatis TaxID=991 RepID=A0A086A006_FLAHY|nr:hypothetical protein IW20_21295 [Flavobacterium hydatis]OXA93347.1 hypothetical protein B0A62_13975 [Flavobacterium hydatis]
MKNKQKISLPVIAESAKESLILTMNYKTYYKYVESKFYQTSKIICNEFDKPVYLKNSNDK